MRNLTPKKIARLIEGRSKPMRNYQKRRNFRKNPKTLRFARHAIFSIPDDGGFERSAYQSINSRICITCTEFQLEWGEFNRYWEMRNICTTNAWKRHLQWLSLGNRISSNGIPGLASYYLVRQKVQSGRSGRFSHYSVDSGSEKLLFAREVWCTELHKVKCVYRQRKSQFSHYVRQDDSIDYLIFSRSRWYYLLKN